MQEALKAGRQIDGVRFRFWPVVRAVAFHLAVVALVFLYLDYAVFRVTYRLDRSTSKSLLGLFRAMGRWPGVLLCTLLLVTLRPKEWPRLVLALLVACGTMAVFSDVTGRIVCRIRPRNTGGMTVFTPAFSRLTDSGRRGASFLRGDVTTAFVLATLLAAGAPRAKPVFFAVAVGTAYWRMSNGSHFLSDVYLSAILGYYGASAWLMICRYRDIAPPAASTGPSDLRFGPKTE